MFTHSFFDIIFIEVGFLGNFSDKKTECINAYSLEKVIEEFDSLEKDENGDAGVAGGIIST